MSFLLESWSASKILYASNLSTKYCTLILAPNHLILAKNNARSKNSMEDTLWRGMRDFSETRWWYSSSKQFLPSSHRFPIFMSSNHFRQVLSPFHFLSIQMSFSYKFLEGLREVEKECEGRNGWRWKILSLILPVNLYQECTLCMYEIEDRNGLNDSRKIYLYSVSSMFWRAKKIALQENPSFLTFYKLFRSVFLSIYLLCHTFDQLQSMRPFPSYSLKMPPPPISLSLSSSCMTDSLPFLHQFIFSTLFASSPNSVFRTNKSY